MADVIEILAKDKSRDEEFLLNMGPQHPSTHGVLRVVLEIEGETVLKAIPDIGFLHRGIEKCGEFKQWPDQIMYTDRMDYVCAAASNIAYVEAVEKIIGCEMPPRAEYIRVILMELSRLSGHLLWLGTHAMDLGAMTVFLYCFREREMVVDVFDSYCGARLTHTATRIGGQPYDFNNEIFERIRTILKVFPGKIDEYEGLLTENRIWLKRTKGVGVATYEEATNLGLSGPMARASGVDWDLRRDRPYSAYPDFDFKIPVFPNGDTYDRYLVRIEEMRQSLRIIEQALENLPEGPLMAKMGRVLRVPDGECYHAVENPKGELGFYIISTGGKGAHRCRIRSPSFCHISALDHLCRGAMIPDVVAVIGTLDIVVGEIDR